MKNMMFGVTMILALLCGVTVLSAQDANIQNLRLHHACIEEIHSTLPTCITIANNSSDAIEISLPVNVEPYIEIEVDKKDNILSFDIKEQSMERRNIVSLLEKNPIRVSLSSASLTNILNTSDMSITFEDGTVSKWFQVINTGTLFINGEALNAKDKIEYHNTGTFTSQIKHYNTDMLFLVNTGFLYTNGTTTAKYIEQASTGIENTDLEVACLKLSIHSTGSGVIKYKGSADEVEVLSTGKAKIRTSQLNREE